MAQDKNAQLRNLIAGYRDSMMLSDIKALIAVLFVAIMMRTVLQRQDDQRAQIPKECARDLVHPPLRHARPL